MPCLTEALQGVLDRREYPRVPAALPAQLLISSEKKTRSTRVTNLSAGGVGLQFMDRPPPAEMVGVLAIDGFGDFNGITTRRQGNLGGLRFLIGEAERHHLIECLTTFVRSGLQSVRSLREVDQWSKSSALSLTRQSGKQHQCLVDDISLQGVALLTDVVVPEGEYVLVGQMFGRVISGLQDHVMVQFLRTGNTSTQPALL
ncbi:MAG: PilZ domain-containing protein [Nitrosospira sp.]